MTLEYQILEMRYNKKRKGGTMLISDIAEILKISSREVLYVIETELHELERQKNLKHLILLEPENYPHRSGKYKNNSLLQMP